MPAARSSSARLMAAPSTLGLIACLLAGCATPPPASDAAATADYRETNDPIEPTNRVFYKVNKGLDTVLLKPAARAYRYAVPSPVRTGIHNVLANASTPVLLSNDILETKPRRAGDTLMRFVINTTIGIGGILDPATAMGYPSHDASFGTTLALWGVGEGPFLFLPILGPSNPRDTSGFAVDIVLDPSTWVGRGPVVDAISYGKIAVSAVDQRERVLDSTDQIEKTALDPYATFRSLYRQFRASEIAQTSADNRRSIPAWFPQTSGQAPGTGGGGPDAGPAGGSNARPAAPASVVPAP